MRAPIDTIAAPLFPTHLPWLNASSPRSTIQRGKPLLVEFWDFCLPNSMRTLPYVRAWHERYSPHGLRVVSVHSPGFEPSRDQRAVEAAVARLHISHPVLIDGGLEVWTDYENDGWPVRYLFDGHARLFEYHYGEGGYEETELAIQQLLDIELEPLAPLRPEDAPGAIVVPQTQDQPGAYSGPYEAGGVWAVLDGDGSVFVNGSELRVEHPGAYPLVEHACHTEGTLELELGDGVTCLQTCFTPSVLAPADEHS